MHMPPGRREAGWTLVETGSVRLDGKRIMKSAAASTVCLLFIVLVAACALNAPPPQSLPLSATQGSEVFCGLLSSLTLSFDTLAEGAPLARSRETVVARPSVGPPWSLVHSIDHPPEQSA